MKSKGTAYLLWALGLFGLAGLHRFYVAKGGTGLIWLFTMGLLLVGQIADVVSIPRMVDEANALRRAAMPVQPQYYMPVAYVVHPQVAPVREVIREREIVTVKVRCQYCGALSDPQAAKCPNCAAPMR